MDRQATFAGSWSGRFSCCLSAGEVAELGVVAVVVAPADVVEDEPGLGVVVGVVGAGEAEVAESFELRLDPDVPIDVKGGGVWWWSLW